MKIFSEAIKLQDGLLHNLSYHQKRVDQTTQKFYRTTVDLSILDDHIDDNKRVGLYKCRVVYSDKILDVEITPYFLKEIKTVAVISNDNIDYAYKYADRGDLNRMVKDSNCDDIIIIKDGLVTDSSYSNLVLESSIGLFTPTSFLLSGTKRESLIDKGIITETRISLADIQRYDTVYFINAMIDLEDNIKVSTNDLVYI